MLHYGELEDVLGNYCELGMYDPKSGTDNEIIVMNLYYTEEDAGRDLKQFIEYMPIDLVDVTVGNSTLDGNYILYIEIEKNKELFEKVCRILHDCAGLGNIEEWELKLYKSEVKMIKTESLDVVLGKTEPEMEDAENDPNDATE